MSHICVCELGQYWFRLWLTTCWAPSHYLNQFWLIINWDLRNKNPVKFELKYKICHSYKFIWKWRLRNGCHFVQEKSVKSWIFCQNTIGCHYLTVQQNHPLYWEICQVWWHCQWYDTICQSTYFDHMKKQCVYAPWVMSLGIWPIRNAKQRIQKQPHPSIFDIDGSQLD